MRTNAILEKYLKSLPYCPSMPCPRGSMNEFIVNACHFICPYVFSNYINHILLVPPFRPLAIHSTSRIKLPSASHYVLTTPSAVALLQSTNTPFLPPTMLCRTLSFVNVPVQIICFTSSFMVTFQTPTIDFHNSFLCPVGAPCQQ